MKKNLLFTAELILCFLIAFVIIKTFFYEDKKFEDFDLGNETSSFFASIEGALIHASKLDSASYNSIINGWSQRGRKKVVLILGNSQTHAINQFEIGQQTYPQILFSRYADSDYDIIAHSIPNANLQELYLLYKFWSARLPVTDVVLPVFIDDLREDGIRSIFISEIVQSRFRITPKTITSDIINKELQIAASTSNDNEDIKALKETTQEKSEKFLNDKLSSYSDAWNYRPNVRGAFFSFLYKLRNTVFNVSPQTKRSLIPVLKTKNFQALNDLCNSAGENNCQVYIYIPPLRKDVDPPYFIKEYNDTKNEIRGLTSKYANAHFKDFDAIIPGRYWGSKDPTAFFRQREFDFMHFQVEGHQILADSLNAFLKLGK